MDVRCENCQVEYELPDAKLRPGGVTVKCVECGHMFKIQKRAATNPGTPPAPRKPSPSSNPPGDNRVGANVVKRTPRRPPTKPPPGARPSQSDAVPQKIAASKSGPKNREWLIRLDDGEIMRCEELSTLQQWIVGGQVSRQSSISRNGRTWKPLGAIAELGKYFDMAEKGRARVGSSQPPARSSRQAPMASQSPIKAPLNTGEMRAQVAAVEASKEEATRAAVEQLSPPGVPRSRLSPDDINTTTNLKAVKKIGPKPATERVAVGSPSPEVEPAREPTSSVSAARSPSPTRDRKTGEWAVSADLRKVVDEGPRGPVGGLARGIPTDDVAFASSMSRPKPKIRGKPDDYGVAPLDFSADDLREVKGPGGAGKWLVLGSLILIAGAAAAIYFLVLKGDGDKPKQAANTDKAAQIDAGAGDPANTTVDGGAGVIAKPVNKPVMQLASRAILHQDAAILRGMNTRLSKLAGADKKVDIVAMRAAVQAALGQWYVDRAADTADAKQAGRHKRTAWGKASLATKLAARALKLDRNNVVAMVAMADGLRVQGKSSRQIDRWLRKALKRKTNDSNALYARALLFLRDNRKRGAAKLLKQLAGNMGESGDTRAQYRIGLLALRAKDYESARAAANAILALHRHSPAAKSLLAKVQAATSVVTTDPMPPETKNGTGGGGGTYEQLLKRANAKAVAGNCTVAMKLYQRALDKNATGLEALTGLGYCHLDKRQFASAHDKFRAALVISSTHRSAMKGIAEAYKQQGLKPQAIAAYRRVFKAHPGLRKLCERQIMSLGGKLDGGTSGGGGGTVTKKPDGKKPDGKKPDGKKPDGKKPDGKKPDGKKPDGNKPDGNKPDGNKPDGNKPTVNKPVVNKLEPKKPKIIPKQPKKSDDRTDG